MLVKEIRVKSILVKSKITGVDYVINPYIGCGFGCKYCYASFMGRFVDQPIENWGSYVYAKVNAVEVLEKQIKRLKNKGKGLSLFLSSVTDPYQGIEAKYKLTRGCLAALADNNFCGEVSILTKSPLVTRDIDILKRLNKVEVGLTITTDDDEISRYFETYAPPVSKRLAALKKLNQNQIETHAFVGPLLPHFVADKSKLEAAFKVIKQAGTDQVFVEHINLSTYIKKRLMNNLQESQAIINKFYLSQSKSYRHDLDEVIYGLLDKYRLKLLGGNVIYHKEKV